jgi:hypothetical protein
MGISHGNRGNTVLHIVIGEGGRGSESFSLKIQPYVEDLFLAYLLALLGPTHPPPSSMPTKASSGGVPDAVRETQSCTKQATTM